MSIRFLLISVAAAVCALWPQGIILCASEHGHVEFEIGGGDCCPTETDDCDDCVDIGSPELGACPAVMVLSVPQLAGDRAPRLGEPHLPEERIGGARPLPLSLDELRSVILLI